MSENTTEQPPEKAVVKHEGKSTTGGQVQRLQVTSFGELERLATVLATSDIVPKDMIKKPANILLALMFGNEIGLTPAQALQNVMVVNGRPSLWGDAVMGLVEQSGLQEWWKDEYKPELDGGTWFFTTKRKGREPVTRTFSEKDAVAAKLDKKDGPWQQYKPRMKFHRARSWALRDVYPDVLKGLRYYEEERDIIETTATSGKVYDIPKEHGIEAASPAMNPATLAETDAPTAPAESKGIESTFKCSGGATTTLDDVECFLVRDDQEPPLKYYHDNPDWHDLAKVAKQSGARLAGTWIDKQTKKGVVRWLTALSLKA